MKMATANDLEYTQVSESWHILRAPGRPGEPGRVFTGYTKSEVFQKAAASIGRQRIDDGAYIGGGSIILRLERLRAGESLTQDQITQESGLSPQHARELVYRLIVDGKLIRVCGIGTTPSMYHLPQ